MKNSQQKERAAATIHVVDAAIMTAKRRVEIAEWLRKQAHALESQGHTYSARFRARYLYR